MSPDPMKPSQGHTLIEMLIAMALSVLVVAALIPLNSLGLMASGHQQKVTRSVNQLQQSLQQLENDIKLTGARGCLINPSQLDAIALSSTSTTDNFLQQPWLAGHEAGAWFPAAPIFDNSNIDQTNDAMQLMFADLTNPLRPQSLTAGSNRLFYLTDCVSAEITRGNQASLHDLNGVQIYPFQAIVFYIRKADDQLILYRQYLNKSGNPQNEPLIDNITSLKITYAEKTSADTLTFNPPRRVSNWNNIIAVHLKMDIEVDASTYSVSRLIELTNLNI